MRHKAGSDAALALTTITVDWTLQRPRDGHYEISPGRRAVAERLSGPKCGHRMAVSMIARPKHCYSVRVAGAGVLRDGPRVSEHRSSAYGVPASVPVVEPITSLESAGPRRRRRDLYPFRVPEQGSFCA